MTWSSIQVPCSCTARETVLVRLPLSPHLGVLEVRDASFCYRGRMETPSPVCCDRASHACRPGQVSGSHERPDSKCLGPRSEGLFQERGERQARWESKPVTLSSAPQPPACVVRVRSACLGPLRVKAWMLTSQVPSILSAPHTCCSTCWASFLPAEKQ